MSVAVVTKDWRSSFTTRTVRHFGWALGVAALLMAIGVLLYIAEKYVLQLDRRFVENPGSLMMRAGGLTHFLMGWIFLFSSARLRNRAALLRLSWWILVGIVLCFVSAQLGGLDNPFLYLFFFCYFLIHEIRDEKNLYQASEEIPKGDVKSEAFLQSFHHFVSIALAGTICVGFLIYGICIKQYTLLMNCPVRVYFIAAATLGGLVFWTGHRCWHSARGSYGNAFSALSAHAPLVIVYGGLFWVILLGGVLGGISLNLLIMIHGGVWIAFVHRRLCAQSANPSWNLWAWLRGSPTGFLVLHAAVLVVVLALMALRVHLWERTGLISQLVERRNFPYWSIMHITMAFWRPR